MNLLFSIFTADILPIFLIAGVGFLLARKMQASVKTLAHVSFYALTPCLAFKLLITAKMTGPQVGRMALMAVLVAGTMGLLARLTAIPLGLNPAVTLSLVVAPLVALALASLLGLSGPTRQAGVALASMPVAVITTILALEFDVAPAFVTNAVFVSTLLSPLTLTPLIAYL